MKSLPHALIAALCFALSAKAAPLLLAIEDGLRYLRLEEGTALPELSNAQALVLDLRYAKSGVGVFAQWPKSLTHEPLFILINSETAPDLVEAVIHFLQGQPYLLIGPRGSGFPLDIPLDADAEMEARAYSALNSESALPSLVGVEERTKTRYDEAAIIAAHANSDEVPRTEPTLENAEPSIGPRDLTLQRAIHLYRAWRALSHKP